MLQNAIDVGVLEELDTSLPNTRSHKNAYAIPALIFNNMFTAYLAGSNNTVVPPS